MLVSEQGMMECPVCLGAFSWREDLLHHFGAVHHLEELIAHLHSEFACESCPPCCRVPRSLFKYHLPEPVNSAPTSVRAGDEKRIDTTECLNTDFSIGKIEPSDDVETGGSGGTSVVDSRSSQHRESSNAGIRSIERYHCDMCEFSANDMQQLMEHGSEHATLRTPSPRQVPEEPSDERFSDISRLTPVRDMHFCDSCPFSTKYPGSLTQHMRAHARSASVTVGFRCGYCDMASRYRSSINAHLVSSHRDQPVKVLQFTGDKVVSVLHDYYSKTIKFSSSYAHAVGKRKKLRKLSRPKVVAVNRNSCSSEKSVTSDHLHSLSSVNTHNVLNDAVEVSAESLENQLPAQMIYRKPVRCPACDFHSRARVNLVRHVHLVHGDHQQFQPTSSAKYSLSSFMPASCVNADADRLTSLPLQV